MNYDICIIGAKDTTIKLMKYLTENVCGIDCVITIDESTVDTAQISGYSPISEYASAAGARVYQAPSYSLKDEESHPSRGLEALQVRNFWLSWKLRPSSIWAGTVTVKLVYY